MDAKILASSWHGIKMPKQVNNKPPRLKSSGRMIGVIQLTNLFQIMGISILQPFYTYTHSSNLFNSPQHHRKKLSIACYIMPNQRKAIIKTKNMKKLLFLQQINQYVNIYVFCHIGWWHIVQVKSHVTSIQRHNEGSGAFAPGARCRGTKMGPA